MPNKITTQQLFDQYIQMNEKLQSMEQKLDSVIEDNSINTRLTGSINEVVFRRTVNSLNTNNLLIGNPTTSSAASAGGINVSHYKKLYIYISNQTSRDVVFNNIYYGDGDRPGGSDRLFYRWNFGELIKSGEHIFLGDGLNDTPEINNWLTVKAPFFLLSLYKTGDNPMSDGSFDVAIIGIRN